MARVLILDDDEARHAEFRRLLPDVRRRQARTAAQAIRELERSPPFDVVFLDHDLHKSGDADPGDGLEVAHHLAHHLPRRQRPGLVCVHSWNVPGREAMARVLREAGIRVVVRPFHV